MSCMPDMTLTSLAAAQAKLLKMAMFLKEEKICYKMVYYTLCILS